MIYKPIFPTQIHTNAAELIRDYFLAMPNVDTVLIVNSCARGLAVPESDLDVAILVNPDTTSTTIKTMEANWQIYSGSQSTFLKYKQLSQFSHLHLDIIDGNYIPPIAEIGVGSDYFEIEIGNQICYSAPMDLVGPYFKALQNKWLPYYNEELRLQRLTMVQNAVEYDLNNIPLFINRGLHFQAFHILYKAFQEYLQALFIANKTYSIAYNKWIKEQVVTWLNKPNLYPKLPPILSISNIESNEINDKVKMLRALLNNLPNE